jgi:hypothetical protein
VEVEARVAYHHSVYCTVWDHHAALHPFQQQLGRIKYGIVLSSAQDMLHKRSSPSVTPLARNNKLAVEFAPPSLGPLGPQLRVI